MKVQLLKTPEGNVKGWELIAETFEDSKILGTIRQFHFWGTPEKGTKPKYDGIKTHEASSRIVISLKYRIPKYEPKVGETFKDNNNDDDIIDD